MVIEENQNLSLEQIQSVIDYYCQQFKVKPIVISAYLKDKGTVLEVKDLQMHPNLIKAIALTLPVIIISTNSSLCIVLEKYLKVEFGRK